MDTRTMMRAFNDAAGNVRPGRGNLFDVDAFERGMTAIREKMLEEARSETGTGIDPAMAAVAHREDAAALRQTLAAAERRLTVAEEEGAALQRQVEALQTMISNKEAELRETKGKLAEAEARLRGPEVAAVPPVALLDRSKRK